MEKKMLKQTKFRSRERMIDDLYITYVKLTKIETKYFLCIKQLIDAVGLDPKKFMRFAFYK